MDELKPQKTIVLWPIVFLTIGLITYGISQYMTMERNDIIRNWPTLRCSPLIMMAAFWLKPDNDPRSPGTFASENFNFCTKDMVQNIMKLVMAPSMSAFMKQADITSVMTNIMNSIKTAIKRMYDKFLAFMDPVFKRFNAIAHQVGIVTAKLKSAFSRVNAALLSVVFTGISTIKAIQNSVYFVIKIVLIILAIMVAIIIILFFVLFPFIPILIMPVIIAIIAVGGVVAAEASDDQGAFCFTGDTPVLLADGSTKPIQEIALGDVLANGSLVEGFFTFDGLQTPLFVIEGIRVSGSHLVQSDKGWHSVDEDTRAKALTERALTLYCLNTSNQIIPVQTSKGHSLLFRDWEEISAQDSIGKKGWDRLVSKLLGGVSNNSQESSFCLMDPRIIIPTSAGPKPLSSIQIGDLIELSYNNSTRVQGLVDGLVLGEQTHHWLNGCIEKIYNDSTAYRRLTTLKPSESTVKGRHIITDSGTLIAYVNGQVLRLRDFTEVGMDAIHRTYPFVAKRLLSFGV